MTQPLRALPPVTGPDPIAPIVVGSVRIHTSHGERRGLFQVLLTSKSTGLRRDSKAQAEQVRSVTIERIGTRVGVLSSADTAALDEALRLHLAL